VTEDGTIGLYKPKGWKVSTQKYPNGRMVTVTDPKDLSYVNMIFLENIDPNLNSVSFAGATLKNASKQMPSLRSLRQGAARSDAHHGEISTERDSSDLMHPCMAEELKENPKAMTIGARTTFKICSSVGNGMVRFKMLDSEVNSSLGNQMSKGPAVVTTFKSEGCA